MAVRRSRAAGPLIPAVTAAAAAAVLHLAVGAAMVAGAGSPAYAAEWTVVPFLQAEHTITDNVNASETDREADTITTTTAGISLSGTGARLQFDFKYAIAWDQVWVNDDQSGVRHNLLSNGNTELIDDLFFIDAGAAVSQEEISDTGPVAVTPRNLVDNQTTVITATASPYLTPRLGDFAESELRYRIADVLFRDNELDSANGVPGDTVIQEATLRLSDGDWFHRFGWTLTGTGTRTDDKDGDTFQRRAGQASLEFQILREIALVGTGGWEDIDDDDFDDKLDGIYWTAGLRLTPGPRTLLRVEYGRRFDDTIWSGELSYRFSPKITLRASYGVDVATQQLSFAQALGSVERDENGNLIDPVTGLPADPNDPRFDLADQAYRQNGLNVSLIGSSGRTNFAFTGFYTKRKFDITTANETTYGGSALLARQFKKDLNGGVTGSYTVTDDSIDDQQTIQAKAFLQYQLSESLSANASYTYLRRERDVGGTLRENAVMIGLRKNF